MRRSRGRGRVRAPLLVPSAQARRGRARSEGPEQPQRASGDRCPPVPEVGRCGGGSEAGRVSVVVGGALPSSPGLALPPCVGGAELARRLKASAWGLLRREPWFQEASEKALLTMSYGRDEMWSGERYDYDRLPRERLPPRHPDDEYHRVVSFGLKKPPLLDRPGDGTCSTYEYRHAHFGYREYEDGRSFAHERRSGPPHRNDDPGYRLPREEHPAGRQPDYRDIRDGLRRKSMYPHYVRERSPHKRETAYFRDLPVSRRDSPHSRSGSSVSSRSYSPDRSKSYAFHQSQHGRSKEKPSSHSLKTSREVSPSGTTAVPPSKTLTKSSSRLSEKELAEAASRWTSEKDKADGSSEPEIAGFDAGSSEQMYVEQHEETGARTADNNEQFEDSQHAIRSKAIAAKTEEIEKVYRQDCETFGAVVKMLIQKDPSLEKPIQFALRQNLHEIGERCIEELKHFIAEYDTASQLD